MLLNYAYIGIMSLYAFGYVRKLYKRQLRGLRLLYKVVIITALALSMSFFILLIDVATCLLIGVQSQSIVADLQYNYILPISLQVFPDLAYICVVIIFYVISATIVNTTVYDSVDSYLKNYETNPEKITYMCFSILAQGLLMSFGYFSLFISLIQLTTWKVFHWDDSGFILVISSILAGAMKYPKMEKDKWNHFFLNSYAISLSLKATIMITKEALGIS